MFGQERENKTRDVVVLLVQGKMAGVEQVDFGIRQIALERLRTGSDERGIVPPPDYQSRWLMFTARVKTASWMSALQPGPGCLRPRLRHNQLVG